MIHERMSNYERQTRARSIGHALDRALARRKPRFFDRGEACYWALALVKEGTI